MFLSRFWKKKEGSYFEVFNHLVFVFLSEHGAKYEIMCGLYHSEVFLYNRKSDVLRLSAERLEREK